MRPLDLPLLTDENIHPDVLHALTAQGKDARSVRTEGLAGRRDVEILRHAHSRGWVLLTHDSDFGSLSVRAGEPYVGIIYLRPGHILPEFVLEMLEAVESLPVDVSPPFIIIAERKAETVRVRVRSS